MKLCKSLLQPGTATAPNIGRIEVSKTILWPRWQNRLSKAALNDLCKTRVWKKTLFGGCRERAMEASRIRARGSDSRSPSITQARHHQQKGGQARSLEFSDTPLPLVNTPLREPWRSATPPPPVTRAGADPSLRHTHSYYGPFQRHALGFPTHPACPRQQAAVGGSPGG